MNSVIEKLAEVETTAETIVEHARQQKSEIERQIQEKKLEKIKEKSQQEVEKVLDRERKKNQTAIDALKQEYEENHEIYAEEIVRHMIEV